MALTTEQAKSLLGMGFDLETVIALHNQQACEGAEQEPAQEQPQAQAQEPAPGVVAEPDPATTASSEDPRLDQVIVELRNLTAAMQANAILNTHTDTDPTNTLDKLTAILAGH